MHICSFVARATVELSSAIVQRRSNPAAASPYHPEAWRQLLGADRLDTTYPQLVSSLSFGFSGINKRIGKTYTAYNTHLNSFAL
jgi:hypothetical protein